MRNGDLLDVGVHALRFVAHPEYEVAHPGEARHLGERPGRLCASCAIAERPDTGERVLLWLCGGVNWSVSRAEPNARHRQELM